ncbi:MAG: hypothetical protein A2X80_06685 [Geobacteraceae bacterium GWB2_52_12]|nr:MAG: hypothetical protein A2X80_06685 [Geobacteraceae bacterium GWB2_52_12]
MQNQLDTSLKLEAKAFDCQITERMCHGHIPDLRLTKECKWFYNNSWRHPEYVHLDFGEQFELISEAISKYGKNTNFHDASILEVGCGPGYLSLELARAGFNVTGIDVSEECINVAEKMAFDDPWKQDRVGLKYLCGDFFSNPDLQNNLYDAVVFLGSLHHFKDQLDVMGKVSSLLKREGLILAHEPTRDRATKGNAVFLHLIRVLLSLQNGFFTEEKIPTDKQDYQQKIDKLFAGMKYEDEQGGNIQSISDNDAGHKEMYQALSTVFKEILYKERYAFFHDVIGGLRFDDATNVSLARYLRDCDSLLCELGVLQPTEFFYVGRKR